MGDVQRNLDKILQEIRPCDPSKDYIFVSYSSRDSHVVHPDILELQRRGFNIWLDEKNLDKTRPSWKTQAVKAIENVHCRLLIFYVSKNSLISEPCFNEMKATQSEISRIFHIDSELGFIALEAEPINNIVEYQKELHLELVDRLKNGEEADDDKVRDQVLLSQRFIEQFFNSNNERVRIRALSSDRNPERYYRDIISCLPSEMKGQAAPVPAASKRDLVRAEAAGKDSSVKKPKKVFKGDVSYSIYGKEYTENQSAMMLRVFAQVLKRHQDKVQGLPGYTGMNCASAVDYTLEENRGDQMPSYFRVCEHFSFDNGQSVSVGTAYDIREKMRKIALLLEYCGEDRSVFQSDDLALPALKPRKPRENTSPESGGQVTYTLFGKTSVSSQADMMYHIFEQVIARHPDKLDELENSLLSVAKEDYSLVPRLERPSYFRAFRVFRANGTVYSVGTSFGMGEKLKQTARLFAICGENRENLEIQGYELPAAGKSSRQKQTKSYLED